MYCSNCGNKIDNGSNFCTKCGNKIDNGSNFCTKCGNKIDSVNNNITTSNEVKNKDSGMKIASIVLGSIGLLSSLMIIFAPVGLILSIIGLILAFCSLKKGKNLPGILLNSIGLVLSLIITVVIVIFFGFVVEAIENGDINVDDFYYEDEFNYDDYDFGDYDNFSDF